jgi:hypothetical protein
LLVPCIVWSRSGLRGQHAVKRAAQVCRRTRAQLPRVWHLGVMRAPRIWWRNARARMHRALWTALSPLGRVGACAQHHVARARKAEPAQSRPGCFTMVFRAPSLERSNLAQTAIALCTVMSLLGMDGLIARARAAPARRAAAAALSHTPHTVATCAHCWLRRARAPRRRAPLTAPCRDGLTGPRAPPPVAMVCKAAAALWPSLHSTVELHAQLQPKCRRAQTAVALCTATPRRGQHGAHVRRPAAADRRVVLAAS